MSGKIKQFYKGLTLIEVMVAMLISLVIVIGVLSYMYACARNARIADVRVTATRLGQTLLDAWKTTGTVDPVTGWHVEIFDPTDDEFDATLPAPIDTTTDGLPEVGTPQGRYLTKIDGVNYFITLSYQEDLTHFYLLNASVAWNRNYSSETTLDSDHESVWLTSYSIY